MLDCNRVEHYPLPAGLHCQSAFDRAGTKGAQQRFYRFVRTPKSRLYGEARRGTLACAGFLLYQSVNPSSLATII
ncbi:MULTISPECIES: hypothetical protein [Acinetobacter calcoaceticus/baumannii complex]|uniref:hypothetical protein n=1 Tax=Acinetobacter calcoaceticus/baumannii complex TaxID=909768 RepID=UPI001297FF80|nr:MULTISPECIES: hypothetical protein [Acinetobacter calcoaceticus/baumannii complex]MBO8215188.1 hypothetical protein [Acinetobacter nosocomialis]MDC4255732.1 hypothetical protein [Acinetobacter baumannii]MDC4466924.1 hypothetical protein [Acinetobacter baumannii]MDC4606343.1 hypothetical protein [Acinetobacter baumannii]MDC5592053.1 hypothetical protein [Acinetobacter baumannii]